MKRALVLVAVVALVAFAIRHPAPRPAFSVASPDPPAFGPRAPRRRRSFRGAPGSQSLVYVVGAVRRPGLYRIAQDGRVDDAVRAAGGLRPDADPAGVNLAARASDGDEIAVPLLGQAPLRAALTKRRTRNSRSRRATKSHAIVNVNSADAEQLASVPGIGATMAERIVAVREQEGTYRTFDELLDVAGMTQTRLDRAQPYLRL